MTEYGEGGSAPWAVTTAFAALAGPALAEPDRFVSGLGLYVGVEGGPVAILLPDYQTVNFTTDRNFPGDGKFTADEVLLGFGGGLSIGLPIDASLLGDGLRFEVRGSLAQAKGSEFQTPDNNPETQVLFGFPTVPKVYNVFINDPQSFTAGFKREATT